MKQNIMMRIPYPLPMSALLFALALQPSRCISAPPAAALADTKGASKLVEAERSPRPKSQVEAARRRSSSPRQMETFSSLDRPDAQQPKDMPAGGLKFDEAELLQVLQVYQELSHRTILRSAGLPSVKVSLLSETALTRRESLQALDSVLAQNGVTMIPLGTKFVKAVPSAQAPSEAAPVIDLSADQLPDSSSYMLYIVELKNRRPRDIGPAVQPFAKMPNSIVAIDEAGILILRDYSANIRRMLQVIDRIEQSPK